MPREIELSSMYTPYTIDTYQTFTFESEEDYIIQSLSEDTGRDLTYDDIDWDFNHKEFVQALAEQRLALLKENIIDSVILSVRADGEPTSPREYNFYTDTAYDIYTVDGEKLDQFIKDNAADYEDKKIGSCSGFVWSGSEDQTKLNYYLRKKTKAEYDNTETYYWDMTENLNVSDFIEYKIIDKFYCENCLKEVEEGDEHCPNCQAIQNTCPQGGDSRGDCNGCVYSPDYHCVAGACERREIVSEGQQELI